jgi:hypothetical protein
MTRLFYCVEEITVALKRNQTAYDRVMDSTDTEYIRDMACRYIEREEREHKRTQMLKSLLDHVLSMFVDAGAEIMQTEDNSQGMLDTVRMFSEMQKDANDIMSMPPDEFAKQKINYIRTNYPEKFRKYMMDAFGGKQS